ncbi:MAG: hypothetical protein OSB76_04430 [Alphaproteobacteria bacterium]|nr:hypothetical protein [Alphaproteobacteria bacterium]
MTIAASLTRIPLAGIVAAGILGTVAVPSLVVSPAVSAKIKLAHFMSPRHPMDRFLMRPWTEQIAKVTNNALTRAYLPGRRTRQRPGRTVQTRGRWYR